MPRRPKPCFRTERRSWFVTIGGVQHNLGPNQSEAYEQFHKLMRKPKLAKKRVHSESLASIADAFLDWTKRHRAEATFGWYQERLQSFLVANPELTTDQLQPYHVEEWAANDDLSINTARNKMRAVKRCLKWAKTQGYIDDNPISDLVIPSAEPKETYISPEEFSKILELTPNKNFRDLLVITYEVGCRPQESLRAEARHVDLANARWVFPRNESKGKKSPRIVYLTDKALAITKELMQSHPTGELFRNQNGNAWTTSAVGCQFTSLQNRIGKRVMASRGITVSAAEIEKKAATLSKHRNLKGKKTPKTNAELREEAKRKLTASIAKLCAPRYSLYSLRHSWATNALKKDGMDALTVAILMGHKDPSTLAKTYQHLSHSPKHLLEQARRAAG